MVRQNGWIVCLTLWCLIGAAAAEDSHRDRYDALRAERDRRLIALAEEQEAAGDRDAAKAVRAALERRDPGREYYFIPSPTDVPTPAGVAEIQREYAAKLFALAKEAAGNNAEAAAFAWLHEVCTHDPQHAAARRILGYRLRDGVWLQSTAPLRTRRAREKHPRLPWPAGSFDWVDSANYQIASTAGENATQRFAERLERWRTVWLQAYYEFWAPKSAIARRLEAGSLSTRARGNKHQVVLFRDRQQYVDTLAALGVQGVEQSTGYYNDRQETIYVYDDPNPDLETWLQEQCHQLCQEVGAAKTDPVENSHIWVVEGLGMFFESLVEYPEQPYATLGGFDARRLQFARIRWLREGYWLPLQELSGLSREAFQTHPQVAALYSQSAGIAHFMMLADDGKYRSPLMQLAKLVYAKRARDGSLAELTGVDLPTLTRECQQWLPARNQQVCEHLTLPEVRTELALGFGDVDSAAGKSIGECVRLKWLQLSSTRVDDSIGPELAKLPELRQLFLDKTQVGDGILRHLTGLTDLEELDLAGTRVTDAGLRELAALKNLKVLWLGETAVSDTGLEALRGLSLLELLDLGGTKVSRDGLRQIQETLPKLKIIKRAN